MHTIKLIGGTLYQWSTGRKVKVIPRNGEKVCEVHFAHANDSVALVVVPEVIEGNIVAEIPNILLQSKEPICAYAVESGENTEKSFCNCTLFVRARPKPDDYVYTETELKTYEVLEKRILKLEEDGVTMHFDETTGNLSLTSSKHVSYDRENENLIVCV